MHPEQINHPKAHMGRTIGRFLGGAITGAGILFIPYTLMEAKLNFANLGLVAVVATVCGFLSVKWGNEFIEAILNELAASGF